MLIMELPVIARALLAVVLIVSLVAPLAKLIGLFKSAERRADLAIHLIARLAFGTTGLVIVFSNESSVLVWLVVATAIIVDAVALSALRHRATRRQRSASFGE